MCSSQHPARHAFHKYILSNVEDADSEQMHHADATACTYAEHVMQMC